MTKTKATTMRVQKTFKAVLVSHLYQPKCAVRMPIYRHILPLEHPPSAHLARLFPAYTPLTPLLPTPLLNSHATHLTAVHATETLQQRFPFTSIIDLSHLSYLQAHSPESETSMPICARNWMLH